MLLLCGHSSGRRRIVHGYVVSWRRHGQVWIRFLAEMTERGFRKQLVHYSRYKDCVILNRFLARVYRPFRHWCQHILQHLTMSDDEDLYQDYLADQNDNEGPPPFDEPPSDLDDDDDNGGADHAADEQNQNANDDNESLGSDASTVEESKEFADPTPIITTGITSSSSKPEYQFEP
jgi:hypothetical protein